MYFWGSNFFNRYFYCEQVLDRIKQLNESSAETVRASSKVLNVGSKRILLMSGIQHSETLDLIEKCEVLINTSRSEVERWSKYFEIQVQKLNKIIKITISAI